MSLQLWALSHAGRVRPNNEDAHALHPQVGLAALADGMGGSLAGEVAAGIAMSTAADGLAQELAARQEPIDGDLQEEELLTIESLMRAATRRANSEIHQRSLRDPGCAGMGTTLLMAVFRGQDLLIGHAGDSRAYRLRPRAWRLPSGMQYRHEIVRLTRDHTIVEKDLAGQEPPRRDAHEPFASREPEAAPRLTRALGVESDVVLELHRHRLLPEDIILLCSDGLTDMVEDARIEQIAHATLGKNALLAHEHDLQHLAQALVDEAMRAGGSDNITVILGARTSDGNKED